MVSSMRSTVINIQKVLLYLKNDNVYLNLNPQFSPRNLHYPISLVNHINGPLYILFDEDGIPIRVYKNEQFYYLSHLASWGLGNWELYLNHNDEAYGQKFLRVADFILKFGEYKNNELRFKSQRPGKYNGALSAMDQGLGISVLTRAYRLTGDKKYIDGAKAALVPFTKFISEGGVRNIIKLNNCIWYEEDTVSRTRHILNGMIYAMFGLYDLSILEDDLATKLWNTGIESLKSSVALFDCGFWSFYWLDDKGSNYIASMLYHSLHVHMLKVLYQISGEAIFYETYEKFSGYSQNMIHRLRAGITIALHKLTMDF